MQLEVLAGSLLPSKLYLRLFSPGLACQCTLTLGSYLHTACTLFRKY